MPRPDILCVDNRIPELLQSTNQQGAGPELLQSTNQQGAGPELLESTNQDRSHLHEHGQQPDIQQDATGPPNFLADFGHAFGGDVPVSLTLSPLQIALARPKTKNRRVN